MLYEVITKDELLLAIEKARNKIFRKQELQQLLRNNFV